MINAYSNLVAYEGNSWEEYLKKVRLIDIFKELLEEYTDKDTFRCAVRYILYAYSVESDMVVLGSEWLKNKQKIFEAIMIKPIKNLYEDLVLIKNRTVLDTINKWLNWQDNDTFTQLQTLKDLRVEMQLSSLTNIKKSSSEIDYDQKFRNAEYSVKLKSMIKDLESELIQNNAKLKDAVKEIRNLRKQTNTLGVEAFAQ